MADINATPADPTASAASAQSPEDNRELETSLTADDGTVYTVRHYAAEGDRYGLAEVHFSLPDGWLSVDCDGSTWTVDHGDFADSDTPTETRASILELTKAANLAEQLNRDGITPALAETISAP